MKKVIKFESSDGSLYNTEQEALFHEAYKGLNDWVEVVCDAGDDPNDCQIYPSDITEAIIMDIDVINNLVKHIKENDPKK